METFLSILDWVIAITFLGFMACATFNHFKISKSVVRNWHGNDRVFYSGLVGSLAGLASMIIRLNWPDSGWATVPGLLSIFAFGVGIYTLVKEYREFKADEKGKEVIEKMSDNLKDLEKKYGPKAEASTDENDSKDSPKSEEETPEEAKEEAAEEVKQEPTEEKKPNVVFAFFKRLFTGALAAWKENGPKRKERLEKLKAYFSKDDEKESFLKFLVTNVFGWAAIIAVLALVVLGFTAEENGARLLGYAFLVSLLAYAAYKLLGKKKSDPETEPAAEEPAQTSSPGPAPAPATQGPAAEEETQEEVAEGDSIWTRVSSLPWGTLAIALIIGGLLWLLLATRVGEPAREVVVEWWESRGDEPTEVITEDPEKIRLREENERLRNERLEELEEENRRLKEREKELLADSEEEKVEEKPKPRSGERSTPVDPSELPKFPEDSKGDNDALVSDQRPDGIPKTYPPGSPQSSDSYSEHLETIY